MTTVLDTRNAIAKGSLLEMAHTGGTSLAETFLNAETVILVDTSGSMETRDSAGGRSRYEQACFELRQLQETLPGKIALLAFSDGVLFCPDGVPYNFRGSTDLAGALVFAKVADVPGMRFIVISDGEPNSEPAALRAAAGYRNRIDTIFVGPEDRPHGREFLQRLAAASGGITVTADRVMQLAPTLQKLLTATA